MKFDLTGKIALVTGGYGHLGTAITKALAQQGCLVYVAGRSKEKFDKAFPNTSLIKFVTIDISNKSSIEKCFENIKDAHGVLDILINNAYFGATNHPEKMSSIEWRLGIEGGLNQCFDILISAIPLLKNSNNGKIINIASMYGMVVPDLDIYNGREEFLNPPNYGTAKAGIIHLTKYYAMYLAKYNINVNAISPGPFPSEIVQKDKEFVKRLEAKTKLKRIGKPSDLDGVVVLLSSEASNYITGQNIAVDGGWTI